VQMHGEKLYGITNNASSMLAVCTNRRRPSRLPHVLTY